MVLVLRKPFFGQQFAASRPCLWTSMMTEDDDDCLDTGSLWPWLVGNRRYVCPRAARQMEKKWSSRVNLRGFDPENITVKTEEGAVYIHAVQENGDGDNVDKRECKRKITLPANVDCDKLVSSFSSEGVLTLTVPLKITETTPVARSGHDVTKIFQNSFEEDGDKKVLKLDFSNFSPDNINVKVEDNLLHIHAKQETDQGFRETFRRIHLPSDIDAEKLHSDMADDGFLRISAPKMEPSNEKATVPITDSIVDTDITRGQNNEENEMVEDSSVPESA